MNFNKFREVYFNKFQCLCTNGQAMVFVLFILAVFGALGGGLAMMWESEIRTRSSDREGLIAFYLAQAALERGKVMVLSGYWAPGTYTISDQSDLDLTQDTYQFRYDIQIINSAGSTRALTGTGRVLDSSGVNEFARREIAATVTGISDNPPPNGLDDDMSGGLLAGSWREQ